MLPLFASAQLGAIDFDFGGGVVLGNKVGVDTDYDDKAGMGINLRTKVEVMNKVALCAGVNYFFPGTPSHYDLDLWQLNLNGHYNFANTMLFKIYGIAGLNYSYSKADFKIGNLQRDVDDSKIGLNLGAGLKLPLGVFGEAKYDTSMEQVLLTVGIVF